MLGRRLLRVRGAPNARQCLLSTLGPSPPDVDIENRSDLLPLVDAALGRSRPPAVEFIIASALTGNPDALPWPQRLFRGNPMGHALVAYRLPDGPVEGYDHVAPELRGQRVVMNVANPAHLAGVQGATRIINFLSLEDMLFSAGSDDGSCGSEQGGVFNRHFTGLRIEELPDADVLAMHHAFLSLASQQRTGRLSFSITGGQLRGGIRRLLNVGNRALGNCSVWTAAGLVAAGLIKRPSIFPGRVWAMMHEAALQRWGDFPPTPPLPPLPPAGAPSCSSASSSASSSNSSSSSNSTSTSATSTSSAPSPRAGCNVNVVHYAEVDWCRKREPALVSSRGELASLTGMLLNISVYVQSMFSVKFSLY